MAGMLLLGGCTAPAGDGGRDPFAGACDYPHVDIGGNAALVGGVHSDGEPVEGATARATETDGTVEHASNEAGCYFLSLEPGKEYDVTWSLEGYPTVRLDDVVIPSGEKRVHHVEMHAP